MCTTCGCSEMDEVVYTDPLTGERVAVPRMGSQTLTNGLANPATLHATAMDKSGPFRILGALPADEPGHDHDHMHVHTPPAAAAPAVIHARMHATTVTLEQEILGKNQLLAERNRSWFGTRHIVALNLMSSPGSGKTTLLERTIRDLAGDLSISVIEGDQATLNDAERIRATGCKVIQVNTGAGCHLEADMLARSVQQLDPPAGSVVMIENVGNLVCPALFDLGEQARVVILSVTEGEDKPVKYPHMFRSAQIMIINKIDLLPHLRFDLPRCIAYAREVNPEVQLFCVSAQTGEGMDAWYDWLRGQRFAPRSALMTAMQEYALT